MHTVSVSLPQQVLSNTWWPLAIHGVEQSTKENVGRILALWLNSTLGILSLLAGRVDTRVPWIKIKKPILHELKVLNPFSFNDRQQQVLIKAFSAPAEQDLQRLPDINQDKVRNRIDSAMMRALGLSEDLATVREMISLEPLVIGARDWIAFPGQAFQLLWPGIPSHSAT